ncbi:hypothetical protein V1264_023839 [Littorina saxatilis]|uniref:NACHT domain-containing protein n=2 Tax=Littorina saxatilis TaxID=31220 RepID=A0AAN9GBP6_9CAEN
MKMDATTTGLMAGRLTSDDIPVPPSQIIRVFLCSTATDSCTERTVFVERVYPKLREYCRHRYGLEFQMVDLAWGMPAEQQALDKDLPTMKIQEILNCQTLSAGPNFVAFIGQKYGPLPLPTSIVAEEYEVIRVALHTHRARDTRNAPLLDQSYVIDTNSVPAVYVIKDVSEIIPDIQNENEEVRQMAENQWQELQKELCVLLQKGAELAYLDGALDSDTRSRYYMSDLEKEVHLGIDNSDNPHKRCVLILRDVVDLKNYIEDPQAPAFAGLVVNEHNGRLEMDAEAQNRLIRLRNRARGLISDSNTLTHEVLWRFEDVIHPELHHEYLEKLCSQLHDVLQRLVDESAADLLQKQKLPIVAQEAMQHWSRCKRVTSDFYPCQSQLQRLQDYVTGFSDRPLVVHGPSGCGKTKLVSKLALEVSEMVPGNLLSLIRYVGFTPKSSDLRQVLLGLCTQMSVALGYTPDDVPTAYKDLQRFFPELLASIPVDTTVVLILDALEQVLPDYNAHLMSWLPIQLPSHIKIVLTTLPDTHGLLDRLRNDLLKDCRSNFVELQPLSLPDSMNLLDHFLAKDNRKISDEQVKTFSDRFLTYSLPLYVKLLSTEARALRSFSDTSQLKLPKNCAEAIQKLFDSLEANHGRPVVSRAMAYMVASVTGVSDLEMEDLLSMDDHVLNHVYRDYHPPLRRIPFAVWLKVRRDVEAFLFARETDCVTVAVWEHESFVQAVTQRYLSHQDDVIAVHSLLADYFLGTWSNRPLPIQLSEGMTEFPPCGAQADRLVPAQPLTFPGYDGDKQVKFNKRMYDQVPRHLVLSGRQVELNTLVLFNYEWLYNKMKALSLQHILADFALNPSEQATLVQEALRAAAPTIEKDINNLPAEITGRLLPYYATHVSIRALIRSCDIEGLKHCALLPNFSYQQVPGSSLQFTLDCPTPAHFLGLVYDERFLLCKKTDQPEVYVFDMLTGEVKDTIIASNGELYVTPNGRYFAIVDHVTEKTVKIHDSGSGEFLGQIILLRHVTIRGDKYKAGPLCLTDDRLCAVVETADTSILFISEVPSCTMLQIVSLDGKSTMCKITPSGQHVMCNSNEFLLIYDLYTAQHVCTVPVLHKPSALTFTADGLRAFLATPLNDQMIVLHLNQGQVDMTYRVVLSDVLQGDAIREVTISPNDMYVLIRSDQNLVVHRRATEKIVAHFVRPKQVPKEFRLPNSHYKELVFTKGDFTRDSDNVIATIFRNIYIWQIATGQLLTTIQAPIGIITSLLVCKQRAQLLTHIHKSRQIHVWNVETDTRKVDTLDKLTAPVQRVLTTSDNTIAYVQCCDSDEVGVIDMRSGAMLDLLTHDSKVQDMAITPSGHMVLVVTAPRVSGTACKLWDLTERKVIKEWGRSPGHCLSLHSANSIVYFSQPQPFFDSPYDISIIHFIGDTHSVHENPAACKYVRSPPVATADDRFLVLSSALGYNDRTGQFLSPCLVVFDMTKAMKRTCYDAKSVGLEDVMEDVVSVEPCLREESCIAVVVTCRQPPPAVEEVNNNVTPSTTPSPSSENVDVSQLAASSAPPAPLDKQQDQLQVGFFILDVREGCILVMNFMQPAPDTPFPPHLVFSSDFTVCMDEASCIYNLSDNTAIAGHIPHPPDTPPQCLALDGAVAVYYKGSQLFVFRVGDAALLARCEVHAPVCHVTLCTDQRTLLVGCRDGTFASYVIVDPGTDQNPRSAVASIKSRQVRDGAADEMNGRLSRSWDKVETASAPPYSRPPSAFTPGSKDRLILRQIKPVPRFRPNTPFLRPEPCRCVFLNERGQWERVRNGV